ncbi:LacI family DNA-binding transcriptional regulator [Egicoccus sp. AB-alg6-2]|uniref:LacI family DNA-binding transcriptional regulator n=1 Tax=Egicoccus sp. AB-alg6-2 TaxID=3242692 RepID=UPI00359D8581
MSSNIGGSVTLADVARHAGVSLATASRVLNGAGGRTVGATFRERVLRSAELLGYSPNAQAQAVARGASSLVGLVVHDISDPYFAAIAAGVTEAAEERDTTVVLASTRQQHERELDYLATLRQHRARAVVLVGSRWEDRAYHQLVTRELDAYRRTGGRVAAVSQDRLGVDTVQPLNNAGARDLARALVDLGHRSFAVLGGPEGLLTARDRVRGFREGLRDRSVSGDVPVVTGAFTRDGGYDATLQLLAGGQRPGCLFAVNDVMAVGAMAALRESGLSVPDDVAVAGFDDIETLRDVTPSLTTVALPLRDMGRQAAEMALTPGRDTPKLIRVRGEVILRDSTKVAG